MVTLFSILTIIWGAYIGTVFTLQVWFLPFGAVIAGIVMLIGSFFKKRKVNIIISAVMLIIYILTESKFFIDEIAYRISPFSSFKDLFVCIAFVVPVVFILGALLFAIKGKKSNAKEKVITNNEEIVYSDFSQNTEKTD